MLVVTCGHDAPSSAIWQRRVGPKPPADPQEKQGQMKMVTHCLTHCPQDAVTFPDIAVSFTTEEWMYLDASQRKLYRDVMLETYQHLQAVGFNGLKPAVISWLEAGIVRLERRHVCAELKPQLQDEALQHFDLGTGSSNTWELGSSRSPWNVSDPARCDSERSWPHPHGDAETLGMSSEGDRKEQSVLTLLKPFPGKSCSKSLLMSPGTQAPPVGQPPDCGRRALCRASPSRQQAHKQSHHGLNPSGCKECGGAFPCSRHRDVPLGTHNGQNHQERQQQGQTLSVAPPRRDQDIVHPGEKLYRYKDSGKAYTYSSSFNVPMRIHTGEKPYKCEVCGRAYIRSSNLIMHMKTHTGELRYVCQECGKAFARPSQLSAHSRVHTGDKPFLCEDCGKTFTVSTYLSVHRKIHTGEKPFLCEDCGKAFLHSSSLHSHRRIHTG